MALRAEDVANRREEINRLETSIASNAIGENVENVELAQQETPVDEESFLDSWDAFLEVLHSQNAPIQPSHSLATTQIQELPLSAAEQKAASYGWRFKHANQLSNSWGKFEQLDEGKRKHVMLRVRIYLENVFALSHCEYYCECRNRAL